MTLPGVANAETEASRQVSEEKLARPRVALWKWLLAIALACVLLYFALRGVEWKRVGSIVSHASIAYLALVCLCSVVSYLVRALRWRVLLNAQGKLPFTTVLWASSIGYLGNNYLPARAGELLRTGAISARSHLSRTYVFATAMAERVIELVILVLMASLMSLTLTHPPLWIARLTFLVALGAMGGMALLLALPWIDRGRAGFIARLPFGERAKKRLHHIAGSVALAVSGLRDPLRLLRFCALTTFVWILDATAGMVLAHAIGMHLLFPVALLLLTGLALGNALPSTPGAVGIFQFAAVTVLVPFGFTRTDAIAFILVAQATTYVMVTALGLIGLWRYRTAADQPSSERI